MRGTRCCTPATLTGARLGRVRGASHGRPSREGRFLAAVLAYGDRAVLSHRSAAVHWTMLAERGPRIDVTVPTTGGRRNRRATILHRCRLHADEVTTRHGIPVTTPARTLIDLADVVARRELERAYDEAHYLRLDLDGLAPIPGRRGAGRLRRLLAEHEAGSTRTRNDFSWPQARLIVETDGWQAHGTRAAFERDRLRDAALIAADWRPLRITWRRLEREPHAVAAQLRTLLAPE